MVILIKTMRPMGAEMVEERDSSEDEAIAASNVICLLGSVREFPTEEEVYTTAFLANRTQCDKGK